jgi:spermidine/putrescine transport system substrate-binding protein
MTGQSGDPIKAGVAPDLLRGLTSSRLSRRRALQIGGLSALGMTLAACGIPGAQSSKLGLRAARAEIDKFWATHQKTGHLNFGNWPLYIDVGAKSKNDHPSIDLFTKQTGIKVRYLEDIQANDTFFAKIQPQLAAQQSTGYDIIVITNGTYLDKLMQLDYLTPLDQNRMPNFYQYSSALVRDTSYDRGNVYTMAWQSGMTGIGYDPKRVGKKITSWNDLMDPALKGKIGMFADNEDLPTSALFAVGVNPETSTLADWKKAAAWLHKQQPLVRKYYDQTYIDALSKGDIWASMAYSGDIFQANLSGTNLEFVIPDEGAGIWTDNMCIPQHASNPVDAMTWMDFVYQPNVAAMLAEGINYITPVPDAQAYILKDAKAATGADRKTLEYLATSPLIFPTADEFSKLHRYRVLDKAEQLVWNNLFEPVYQS